MSDRARYWTAVGVSLFGGFWVGVCFVNFLNNVVFR